LEKLSSLASLPFFSVSLVEAHGDLVAVDSNFVGNGRLGGRHTHGIAGANVEFGAVSRANEAIAVDLPFAEWSAVVRTHVIEAINIPLQFN
jgi:hypothetical protein